MLDLIRVDEEDDDRSQDIGYCHEGDDQLGDGRHTLLPADDDDGHERCDE